MKGKQVRDKHKAEKSNGLANEWQTRDQIWTDMSRSAPSCIYNKYYTNKWEKKQVKDKIVKENEVRDKQVKNKQVRDKQAED